MDPLLERANRLLVHSRRTRLLLEETQLRWTAYVERRALWEDVRERRILLEDLAQELDPSEEELFRAIAEVRDLEREAREYAFAPVGRS